LPNKRVVTQKRREVAETYSFTNPSQLCISQRICFSNSVYKNIEIRALEKGSCKIYVDEGQYVKEGQLLFKILPTMYELNIKSNRRVKAAEIEVQNTRYLIKM
jgi:membrane fusion protein (multidrug efflux system)